jgi:hypothetical protein
MSDTPAASQPQPPAATDLRPIVIEYYFLFLVAFTAQFAD